MANQYLSNADPKEKVGLIISGGGADSLWDLQFNGPVAGGEDFDRGSLVSYNSEGNIVAGLCHATAMPMFAINGAVDYDAGQFNYNLQKDTDGDGQGTVNCLVATGGFELAITAYNNVDHENSDYVKGRTLLKADDVTDGLIEPADAAYSDATVVGCVSAGVDTAREGINRARLRLSQKALLRFWTMFLPPVNTA